MPKLKDYHVEEYIFSFEAYDQDFADYSCFSYLSDRVNTLLKTDFKYGTHDIHKIYIDDDFHQTWMGDDFMQHISNERNKDDFFPGHYCHHHFLVLDKNIKRELDKKKLELYQTIVNQDFLASILKMHDEAKESILSRLTPKQIATFTFDFAEGWRPAIEELCDHKCLLFHEQLITDLLICRNNEKALNNIDSYLQDLTNYSLLHKNTVTLVESNYYDKKYYSLKTQVSDDVTAKDIALIQELIKYCQNIYIKPKNKTIKFDVDKFIKLKQLDLDQDLKDWQKADKIFNSNDNDIPMIKPDDDRRRINIIKTLRKRGKQYLR